MLELLITTVWLFLPAILANMAPVLFKWVPLLDVPLDFKATFRGKRVFGSHKTWRGLVIGTLVATGVGYLQATLGSDMPYTIVEYTPATGMMIGALLGFGALVGDAIKSFFKRQVDHPEGSPWLPFDQIDWIVGALIAVSIIEVVPLNIVVTSLVLFGLLHPLTNTIGYYLGIRSTKL